MRVTRGIGVIGSIKLIQWKGSLDYCFISECYRVKHSKVFLKRKNGEFYCY